MSKARRQGMPSGRTSMLELPAHDLLATRPKCSAKRHHQPWRRPHERKLGDQTKDDADKEPREERYCGRSQTLLYNDVRPHSALGNLTPSEYADRSTPGPQQGGALRYTEGSAPRPVAPPSSLGSN